MSKSTITPQEDLFKAVQNAIERRKNPVKLTFENLEYEVEVKLNAQDAKAKGQKTMRQRIVKGASGYALPGQALYIMGSSGAGKTSLLNLISDRIASTRANKMSGKVLINDTVPLTQSTFGQVASYVMQDDVLFHNFTPREALRFAARLKLPISIQEQDKRVEDLLHELGLLGAADTLIGNARFKSLSGGERKRTAIGVELISDPSMILLDEPTSGLDSFKALSIVKLLQKLARNGMTVIATLHQPSSEAFTIFDRLILMADGHIMYQGLARDSTKYFSSIGLNCPLFSNPADYYMKVLTINYPKQESDEKKLTFMMNSYDQRQKSIVQKEQSQIKIQEFDFNESRIQQTGFCFQMKQLIGRNSLNQRRDPRQTFVKIFQTIFMALVILPIFWDLSGNGFVVQMGLAGAIFFMLVNMTFGGVLGTILVFQDERPVFLREFSNRMYQVPAYYLAKVLVETPVMALNPLLNAIIVYFGIGLTATASQFFYFYLITLMVSFCAASIGYFVSSLFEKEEDAVGMAPLFVLPQVIFGGFFANSGNYPVWIGWLQYLSPLRYGQEALIINEFLPRTYKSNEINLVDYLKYDLGMTKCLVIMLALIIGFRIISMIFLRLLVSKFQ
ncbi:abc transporter family protein [Stylonychia lemnae]|uniref:Abc transporter family protein n=1 Tax=Stylonychia lemnae TaxID=5949 RepID=A0A077ZVC2_STYLE|nr:abc transporter family protein [Stylonychia lemnae]|eukprot:CDW73845.1 abc transporter family protein [Stylonychia lemnae]